MEEHLNRLSDPKVFGPGKWDTIHDLSMHAKTRTQKEAFIESMNTVCRKLKCQNCKQHCTQYMETHPIRNFMNIRSSTGEDIGMFKWSWMFHNAVNARLGKPLMDWDTAYTLYSEEQPMICTKDCGSEDPPPKRISHQRFTLLSRKSPALVQVVGSSRKSLFQPFNS